MNDYATLGVAHLWIIDPQEQVAYDYAKDGLLKLTSDRLVIPGTEIYVDLSTIFPLLT